MTDETPKIDETIPAEAAPAQTVVAQPVTVDADAEAARARYYSENGRNPE